MAKKERRNKATEGESKILCMTKSLIPCKLLFFVINASYSSLFSFLSLFYVSCGLTVTQLGLIKGIGSGFSVIAQPLWGCLVDSAIKHRTVLMVSLGLGSTILEFGKPWLVMYVSETKTIIKCTDNATAVNTSSNCSSFIQLLNPDTVFYAAAINGVLSSVVYSGLMTYLEGAVIKTVFSRKTEHSYGQQKVFAPIGMAIGSFGTGVAVDHYKPKNMSPYLAAFYIYLPLSLLQIPLSYILAKQAKWEDGCTMKGNNKLSLMKHITRSLKNRDNLMFLLSVFIAGLTSTVYGDYLFLFMNDIMHPSKTVMSLTTVAASISELFVYPFTSKLIKLFGGHMRCIILGMLIYSGRIAGVSFCRSAWYVLPIQLLHGFASSLAWTAMIERTWMIFPKEITNTAIGILVTLYFTGTGIISNIVGGLLYHMYGGARIFRAMAIINGIWCIIMIFYFECRNRLSETVRNDLSINNGYCQHIDVEEDE